ncbi:MAG: M43 family zinc metalloprotease [Chitinophagaceae bacterium]|nr:M43 family zinc metalloprotease [Chitinophagaceae bacterium]
MDLKIFLCVFFFFLGYRAYSQNRCVSVEVEKAFYKNLYDQKRNAFETFISHKKKEKEQQLRQNRVSEEALPVYTIPVVVHIIHNGEEYGTGSNIPDSQVFAQIDILNKDYRRKNQDTIQTQQVFKNVVGDTYIEFVLARQDANGNATNGIVRVKGNKTTYNIGNGALELSKLSVWDPQSYLNIWVCNAGASSLGYAQFPVSYLPGLKDENTVSDSTDGVVINYRAFGLDYYPIPNWNYAKGRTATHEIGHYLGLNHIWGDASSCDGTDYCDDTPPQAGFTTGCSKRITCGGQNMIENFLDYTYDQCMNSFTKCQRTRMRIVLENSPRRVSLRTSKGLHYPNAIIHDIEISAENIPFVLDTLNNIHITIQNNGNRDIQGFHLSKNYNGVIETIFYPDTLNPKMKLQKQIPISHTVRGKNTITFTASITPSQIQLFNDTVQRVFYFFNPDTLSLPLIERFLKKEQGIFTAFGSAKGGHTWQAVSDTTNTVNTIMKAPLFTHKRFIRDEYWLVSDRLSMEGLTEASFFFDVAFSSSAHVLQVYASDDGGKSWIIVPYQNTNKNIFAVSVEYYPQKNDWENKYINLSHYAGKNPIQIAFVAVNNGTNNLFLDNIEFFISADSLIVRPKQAYIIYPNPASAEMSIAFSVEKKQNISINILTIRGESVFNTMFSNVLNQTFSFSTHTMPRGIYIMKIQAETFTSFKKIILH